MLFDFTATQPTLGDDLVEPKPARWGADSEFGRLTDVMLSAPHHLELVPCNAVAIEHHRSGASCCPDRAGAQHRALADALEAEGVRCHFVPPREGMPDLSFTRDATAITPWGLVGLRPAVAHRGAEVDHVLDAGRSWGVPVLGTIDRGTVEGGDVCLLRPGIVAIGMSGERTNAEGATALAALFERRGWRALIARFDPHFLHLDTHFTMIERDHALACIPALEPAFRAEVEALGITLLPVTEDEVRRLGGNLLSLGGGRLVSSADNERVNALLETLGYKVIRVTIDQFARCGGGIHCLTLPLARRPA